jgi:hypothetical protein
MALSYKSLILTYILSLIIMIILLIFKFIYITIHIVIYIIKRILIIIKIFLNIYKQIFIILFLNIYDDDNENDANYHFSTKKEYNNDIICPICFENKINSCSISCGHTYCNTCIKKTNKCFICRKPIDKYIKIYI